MIHLDDAPLFFEKARHALRWITAHTGIPVILVAAALLVVSWRIAKKTARFVAEVIVVAVLLIVATKLGWIRF